MTDPVTARALAGNAEIVRALNVRGRAFLNEYICSGSPVDERAFSRTPYPAEASLILACIEKGIVFRRPLIETASKASRSSGRMVGKALDYFDGHDLRHHLWHKVEIAPGLHVYKPHHQR